MPTAPWLSRHGSHKSSSKSRDWEEKGRNAKRPEKSHRWRTAAGERTIKAASKTKTKTQDQRPKTKNKRSKTKTKTKTITGRDVRQHGTCTETHRKSKSKSRHTHITPREVPP